MIRWLNRLRNRILDSRERGLDPATITHDEALRWFSRRQEEYERLVDAAARWVAPGDVILDIGANIGYFSLLLSRRIGFRGTAYLFEPVPNLADLCRQTFAAAPFRAEVLAYGLGDTDGDVDLMVSRNGNIGWNTLVTDGATGEMTRLRVPVRAFDSTSITAVPSFIKIDVEGAEYRVLRGMAAALDRWRPRPVILCEVGWGREHHPQWAAEVAAFSHLASLGYAFRDLDGRAIEVATLDRTTDVMCVPAGAAGRRG